MSLKYRDSAGTETPVAGLNGTSGELVPSVALMKSGTAWFEATSAGAYASQQITFDAPMPDTNYTVVVENSEYRYTVYVTSKTINGFYIGVGNVTDEASITRGIKWTAFKLMTDTVHEADSAHIAQNTANFASAFSDTVSYAVGDYVTYNNVLYRCTTAHTAGVWVAGHFTQVTVGSEVKLVEGSYTAGLLTPASPSYAYKQGSIVCCGGTANISSAISAWTTLFTLPFTPRKQLQVVLYDDVTNLGHLASILTNGAVQLHTADSSTTNRNYYWNFTYC